MLVILHGRFTMNTELDKILLVTLNTTFIVDFVINSLNKDGSDT